MLPAITIACGRRSATSPLEIHDDRAVVGDLLGKAGAAILVFAAIAGAAPDRKCAGRRLGRQHVIEARARTAIIAPPERRARQRPGRPAQVGRACQLGEVVSIAVLGGIEVGRVPIVV